MKVLLDTSAFLWAILNAPQLSKTAQDAISDPANQIFVSSASFWEISIKYGLGKLPLPDEPDQYLPRVRMAAGYALLPVGETEVCLVHRLPDIHRDPFDRLLIAQANCHRIVLVTNDPMITRYPVQSLW